MQIPEIKKVTIVVPVYNEKNTLLAIIEKIQAVKLPDLQKEIILVDDCSTDGTKDIYPLVTAKNVKKIFKKKNEGKGAALRTGFENSTGDVIIIQDADLEYNPEEYMTLLEPLLAGNADVVYGSRFMGNKPHRVLYFWHFVGNSLLTLLSNMFTNLNLTDMETCYKVFRRDILKKFKLEQDRFGFEPEFTAKIAKIKDIRIYEVGISYFGRTYSEGKKINYKDGLKALYCILKYNLF